MLQMCKNCSKTVRESGLDLDCQTDVFTWPLRIRKEARRYFHSNRVISRSKSGKNPAQPPSLPLESSLPFQDRIGPRPPAIPSGQVEMFHQISCHEREERKGRFQRKRRKAKGEISQKGDSRELADHRTCATLFTIL